MSQFGARGQALEGKSAIEILEYYYTGVTVEPVDDSQNMRVNIGHLLTSVSMKTDTSNGVLQLFAGDVAGDLTAIPIKTLQAKDLLSFTLLGNAAFPSVKPVTGNVQALASGKLWTIRWSGTRYLTGVNGILSTKVGTAWTAYRYGEIQIKLVKASALGYRIEMTNTVRLHDEYLWGISEVPSSWPLAAMQAQAIASRTYALNRSGLIKTACDCDIYGSSKDQTFAGYSKEIERKYGKLWKAAVSTTSADDSTGYAVLYQSIPISAYYFSSSWGNSENAIDAWGTEIPYAHSVPDPWSLDVIANPRYAHWQRDLSQTTVSQIFSLPDVLSIRVGNKNASGSNSLVIATSSAGKTVQLTGSVFTLRSKLPSAYFDVVGAQIIAAPSISPTQLPSPTSTPVTTPTPSPTLTELRVRS
ncbi:MAG: hypothetical protein NTX12_08475 [Actinobacteria bacterium]|nr:hypothetical protein [Actinomycetota bacterium]